MEYTRASTRFFILADKRRLPQPLVFYIYPKNQLYMFVGMQISILGCRAHKSAAVKARVGICAMFCSLLGLALHPSRSLFSQHNFYFCFICWHIKQHCLQCWVLGSHNFCVAAEFAIVISAWLGSPKYCFGIIQRYFSLSPFYYMFSLLVLHFARELFALMAMCTKYIL